VLSRICGLMGGLKEKLKRVTWQLDFASSHAKGGGGGKKRKGEEAAARTQPTASTGECQGLIGNIPR